jgi:hypothetical protein
VSKVLSTQTKGKSAEYLVVSDLLRQGDIEVYLPASDEVNTDLVIYRPGGFKRIQIKAVGVPKNETSIEVRMRDFKKNDHIDYVAIVHWKRQIIAYYPYNQEKTITLALKTAKNNQEHLRKWFYSYEELV